MPQNRVALTSAPVIAVFVGLSVPVVGAGIALNAGVSTADTVLGFAIFVSLGVSLSGWALLGRRPAGTQPAAAPARVVGDERRGSRPSDDQHLLGCISWERTESLLLSPDRGPRPAVAEGAAANAGTAGYAVGPPLVPSGSARWSWRRELIWSLAKTLRRCHSTVCADKNS